MEHKCERCGAEYNIQIQDGLLMMRPKDKNDKKAGCKVMKKMNDNKPAVQAVQPDKQCNITDIYPLSHESATEQNDGCDIVWCL